MPRSPGFRVVGIFLLLLCGCATLGNTAESARAALIARVGENTRIAGPMTPAQLSDLPMLAPADAAKVRALALEGAWIFSLLVPDTKSPRYQDDGSLAEMIKNGPVFAVRRGKIVAEFAPID